MDPVSQRVRLPGNSKMRWLLCLRLHQQVATQLYWYYVGWFVFLLGSLWVVRKVPHSLPLAKHAKHHDLSKNR